MKKEDFDDYTRDELLELFVDTLNNIKSDGDCYNNISKILENNSSKDDYYYGFSSAFVTDSIRIEMDADMEDSGMVQGEIEGCLNHWNNKYFIIRKGKSSIVCGAPSVYKSKQDSIENLTKELFEKLSQPISKEQQDVSDEANEIISDNFWELD